MAISRMDIRLTFFVFAQLFSLAFGEDNNERDPRLSIFQVVKFSNDHCIGGSRNGTCFTQAECDNIAGSKDGTCADGFGVCCIVTLSVGQASSANNSYIIKSSTDILSSGGYQYTICPCSDDICRIKFDFDTFEISGPMTGDHGTVSSAAITVNAGTIIQAAGIGDCTIDSFSITSPSGRSSPVICGTNPNQHMILDVTGSECITVNLGIGGTSTVTRELDIKVIQYRCGDEQGGPSGCLQYYDMESHKIRSFNFPDVSNGAAIAYNYIHLSRQHYKACIRRSMSKQYLCYIGCTTIVGAVANTDGIIATNQPSFGLSQSPTAASAASIGTWCLTDFVSLGSTTTAAIAAILATTPDAVTSLANRYCGRYFQTGQSAAFITQSVCTVQVPYELGVDFDDDEVCTAVTNTSTCELFVTKNSLGGGGGILGFSLCYAQS